MVLVTRLNGTDLWLNPLLIESLEQTPDTIVTLTNGHKYVVKQRASELSRQIQMAFHEVGLVGAVTRKDDTV